ncbi:MAG: 2-C-methyl-D-erythritol 4-phosphate cytidylyltransferase [Gracilimonas sp.]|uniref:2-C-methyl-D-erythritol 4-phosphate cytidylyltransferase n=1 Tax=Gracilimonas TaxID=649462 RepID=UPI001B136E89|nr:2-C-methyl-D-erythritol 4-phosphate cytidylyltransferase [Gracilimonas sp.]MBO6585267.1 2-C-methyl-D-erythritol 4-phosphate cytidylyltransferase [Gracilimonas sp.]MBO6615461.1 2-C-methyl-D-erythritol 4-phosphate cytidylyltransferase [Gracilimonas sp.]
MSKLSVIIPAAGSGERMGSDIPKPFIKVGDKAILEHTISRFLEVPDVAQIIIATSKSYIPAIKSMFEQLSTDIQLDVVEGGTERQFSIYNALKLVFAECELVAVHDAVRPFVRKQLIEECCEVASNIGGAVLGVPAKDTIKKVDAVKLIESTPDRSVLWQAQTPQVFQKELLVKAYESALDENFIGTDDASLVERIGGAIQMVEGDRENLKITYPVDLKVAELILGEEK